MRIMKKIKRLRRFAADRAGVVVRLWRRVARQAGQQPTSTKGAVLKGKAPVNKEVLKVKLPRGEEATLKNGLRVVLLESDKVPTFNMQMVVLSGGLSDKPDYRGLASSTAALLREGTTKRSSKDIAEQLMLWARRCLQVPVYRQ